MNRVSALVLICPLFKVPSDPFGVTPHPKGVLPLPSEKKKMSLFQFADQLRRKYDSDTLSEVVAPDSLLKAIHENCGAFRQFTLTLRTSTTVKVFATLKDSEGMVIGSWYYIDLYDLLRESELMPDGVLKLKVDSDNLVELCYDV